MYFIVLFDTFTYNIDQIYTFFHVLYFVFQTCDDLGFTNSDKEWLQIRKMLQQKSNSPLNEDLVVRSEDFFSAIHTIMINKQNRQRISGSDVKVSLFL